MIDHPLPQADERPPDHAAGQRTGEQDHAERHQRPDQRRLIRLQADGAEHARQHEAVELLDQPQDAEDREPDRHEHEETRDEVAP
jgi:hypothetical protein